MTLHFPHHSAASLIDNDSIMAAITTLYGSRNLALSCQSGVEFMEDDQFKYCTKYECKCSYSAN